jgi:hypothetical protein
MAHPANPPPAPPAAPVAGNFAVVLRGAVPFVEKAHRAMAAGAAAVIVVNDDDAPLRLTLPAASEGLGGVEIPVVCVGRAAGATFPRRAAATLWIPAPDALVDARASEAERDEGGRRSGSEDSPGAGVVAGAGDSDRRQLGSGGFDASRSPRGLFSTYTLM